MDALSRNEVSELHDLYGKAFEDKYHEYEMKAQNGEILSHSMPAIDLWKQMLKMLFETGTHGSHLKTLAISVALRTTV